MIGPVPKIHRRASHTPCGPGPCPACTIPLKRVAFTPPPRLRAACGAAMLSFSSLCCLSSSTDARALYRQGVREYETQNLDRALTLFTAAAKKDGKLYNARLMAAKVHYFKKEFPLALEELERILKNAGDHTGALYWKARVLSIAPHSVKDGATADKDAMHCLRRVLEYDAHHVRARALLALLYEKNKHYREALQEYHLILLEEETVINARANLALLYRRMGLADRSKREIDTAYALARAAGLKSETLKAIKKEIEP